MMPPARATELAERLLSLLPDHRRWFGNEVLPVDWEGDPHLPRSWHPCTYRTFDSGLIAVAEGRAWIAWFTDED
jgi:hypothetical protein